MSGHRTNPVHIVTATTRRVWSADEKRALVAEAEEPGATMSEAPLGSAFVSLALPGPVDPPRSVPTAGTTEIEVTGGHRLRIEGHVDATVLRGVIEALVGR